MLLHYSRALALNAVSCTVCTAVATAAASAVVVVAAWHTHLLPAHSNALNRSHEYNDILCLLYEVIYKLPSADAPLLDGSSEITQCSMSATGYKHAKHAALARAQQQQN
jgi:hypothetical protein